MTNFNFKFLGAWLVIVASITGLQAQNDFTLKGKDEMVPAGVWNDVNLISTIRGVGYRIDKEN